MKARIYAVLGAILWMVGCGGGAGEDVARAAFADVVSWRGVVFSAGTSGENQAAAAALDPCVLGQLYPEEQGPYIEPIQHPAPNDHIWAYAFSNDNPDDVEGALATCGHGSEIEDLDSEEWFPLPCGDPFPPCP